MSTVAGLRLEGNEMHAGPTENPLLGCRWTKAGARSGKLEGEWHLVSSILQVTLYCRNHQRSSPQNQEEKPFFPCSVSPAPSNGIGEIQDPVQ